MSELTLASASPRRQELLAQIGVPVVQCPVDLDESVLPGEEARTFVERLAREKAEAGWLLSQSSRPALGSDTAVVLSGQIMGKPRDKAHALEMLRQLSGHTHQVMTGVAVTDGRQTRAEVVITDVSFYPLTDDQLDAYWASGEPCDKAGAYGIQGLGAVFVKALKGSYSGVVGLPLAETAQLLAAFDIAVWQNVRP